MKEKRRISEYVIFWLKRGVSSRVLYVSLIKNEIINNNHSMFEKNITLFFYIFVMIICTEVEMLYCIEVKMLYAWECSF